MSAVNNIPIADLVSKLSEELTDYQRSVIDKAVVKETKKL